LRKNTAVIAMSGGVDSSVAALLVLREYKEAAGVTLKLFDGDSGCCSIDDVEDARSVCQRLGIAHYTLNYKEAFEEQVIEHFVRSYEQGLTPNPCIECNRHMKFDKLFHEADSIGFDAVATGHYARITKIGDDYYLQKGIDRTKDQSYVLYMIARERLSRLRLPLGGMTKKEVREVAEANGFVNARKKDSQDICFVPDGNYASFIERYTGKQAEPGRFVDVEGKELGRHSGALRYTVGQRRGLGISYSEPLYVKSKRGNDVVVAADKDLYSRCLTAESCNVLVPDKIVGGVRLSAKTRYSATETSCRAEFVDDGKLLVEFDEPVRAITSGQAVVLYDGDTVVLGGTIS